MSKRIPDPSTAQKEAEVETFYVNALTPICNEVKQHYLDIDVLARNLLIEVKIN